MGASLQSYADFERAIQDFRAKLIEAGAIGVVIMYTTCDTDNMGGRFWGGNPFACEGMIDEMKDQFREYNRTVIHAGAQRDLEAEE